MPNNTRILESLNVRVTGSGKQYLVLAHGFGTDQSAWGRILPFFKPYYRIVLCNLVCAGSVNPDYFDFNYNTNLDAFVDDLLNILDIVGVKKCAYVGTDQSAQNLAPQKTRLNHVPPSPQLSPNHPPITNPPSGI
ncbi:strigolactone esterase D14-like [Rosa chinensis]|uniref:strigolactone esterase D14-like n=1 Tax=Rosa chinensis TaxID=74649 RepID=UPI000D08ED82|nr:strigolactone esterase D14-like [Rosa chinensis]